MSFHSLEVHEVEFLVVVSLPAADGSQDVSYGQESCRFPIKENKNNKKVGQLYLKAFFSIDTTPRCRGGFYSFT